MKKPEWHSVLESRAALIAGLVGLAIVWPLTYYISYVGHYALWGLSHPQWKAIGTLICMLAFAVPYWLTKWLVKQR